MSRLYQSGDGFGYLLSFRRQGSSSWQTARVPGADAQHFVYSNDSIQPYTPFEVKIRSYNRQGDGPESLTAVVYSAEEGGLRGSAGPTLTLAQGRRREDLGEEKQACGALGILWASSFALGPGGPPNPKCIVLVKVTLWDTEVSQECIPILYWSPEPRVAPAKVWAKGSSSSEMNVSWEPVQQDMNGVLLGYEVSNNWGQKEAGLGFQE